MNDNDIIKALKCCIHEPMLNCRNCPYEDSCNMGRSDVQRDVFALINRQKVEIDKLKLTHALKISEVQEHYRNQIGRARAEAIREFAKRLKAEIEFSDTITKVERHIDNLVKEMTEDQE